MKMNELNTDQNQSQPEEEINEFLADIEEPSSQRRVPIRAQLSIIAVLLLLLLGNGLWSLSQSESESNRVVVQNVQSVDADSQNQTDPFTLLSLTAESVFVWDIAKNKVLYQKNPDQTQPLASVTKLMTIMLAHELMKERGVVTIDEVAISQAGDSGVAPGEQFSLETLADLTIMTSSNDGAYALAAATGSFLDSSDPATAFVKAMNIRADELELSQTHFRNPTGLDISQEEAGAYGSARDAAFLMTYILKNYPGILEATTKDGFNLPNLTGQVHAAENTNPVVNSIPGLIGSKTGYTTLAGGNLVVAFDAGVNRPIVISVLNSSYNGRFNDVLELVEAAKVAIQMSN